MKSKQCWSRLKYKEAKQGSAGARGTKIGIQNKTQNTGAHSIADTMGEYKYTFLRVKRGEDTGGKKSEIM